ncbi:MAG: enoyl-CoA hydratase/isomerase family protein [Candidatus Limnocylindrales bacterium]
MADGLRVEIDGAVATLTLDRPAALNALTVPLKLALLGALTSIAADRAIRAVILTGAGRAFCAGQDLAERDDPAAAKLDVELRERYHPIIRAMRAMDQPVIAAVNGVAAGAGASLAFACRRRGQRRSCRGSGRLPREAAAALQGIVTVSGSGRGSRWLTWSRCLTRFEQMSTARGPR